MRYVDRSTVPVPDILRSNEAMQAVVEARRYFSRGPTSRAEQFQRLQQRFEWNWGLLDKCMPNLRALFHSKCAFCETSIPSDASLNVTHFRPVVSDQGSRVGSGGYWWLFYEWENLYLACAECQRASRGTFPVKGPRATPNQLGEALKSEQRLLLDPCEAGVESELTFERSSGRVTALSTRADLSVATVAVTTIEVFQLNRPELVERRTTTADALVEAWVMMKDGAAHGADYYGSEAVDAFCRDDAPHAACMKVILASLEAGNEDPFEAMRRFRHSNLRHPSVEVPPPRPLVKGVTSPPHELVASAARVLVRDLSVPVVSGAARQDRAPRLRRPAKPPTPATPKRSDPGPHGWYIERVEIENFKAIRKLSLDIPRGTVGHGIVSAGWKVLLGENGCGKSSVLQAIVLAFTGQHTLDRRPIAPSTLLRRDRSGKRAGKGFVKIYWVGAKEPATMTFTMKRLTFGGLRPAPNAVVMRAYGATRHLPRGRHKAPGLVKPVDAGNLFNPFVPVCDADAWFSSLKGGKAFGSAALSLKDVLGLTPRTRVRRRSRMVTIRVGGVDATLDELSAGYQSVVVLATDIMRAVHGQTRDMRHATGIVIVDELDAHLHPRWKMQIVSRLRRCFPGVQFIVTTHEPLCLRGVRAGELAVMRRVDNTIRIESDVPAPDGLRVDQLLTSPLFGLYSTIDPQHDADFQKYYSLLAEKNPTIAQRAELSELEQKIPLTGILGDNRRDQLMYQFLDQVIAREHDRRPTQRVELAAADRAHLLALWNDSKQLVEGVQ
jgi:uncharacterized protein (TIGR02646 family)